MAVLLRRHKDYVGIIDGTAIGAAQRLTEVENERYRTNHAHVGALLARSWLLPEPLCLAVLHHHDLEALTGKHAGVDTDSIQLIAVAALAEKVYVTAAGEVPSRELELAAPLAAVRLGVNHARLVEFADFVESE
jgi:HD-like signal output (HDOD) protein